MGAPHHYLSEESKALIGHDSHFKKVYVLGRIILKDEKVAPALLPPYNLAPGTVYYELSVESISDIFPGEGPVAAVDPRERTVAAHEHRPRHGAPDEAVARHRKAASRPEPRASRSSGDEARRK